MTKEEAIKVLMHTFGNINYDAKREEIYFTDQWVQAYEMAIDALRAQQATAEAQKNICPCYECNTGWGMASSAGVETCEETCPRFKAWCANTETRR